MQPFWIIISRDPYQTNRFCRISVSCFLLVSSFWIFVTIFCPKQAVTGDVWRPNIVTFHTASAETGGKSLHALVGSAASGAEIHFIIILLTLWWNKKSFFVQRNLNFALMYRNNIEFYSFFAIEWTAKFTENIGLPGI